MFIAVSKVKLAIALKHFLDVTVFLSYFKCMCGRLSKLVLVELISRVYMCVVFLAPVLLIEKLCLLPTIVVAVRDDRKLQALFF